MKRTLSKTLPRHWKVLEPFTRTRPFKGSIRVNWLSLHLLLETSPARHIDGTRKIGMTTCYTDHRLNVRPQPTHRFPSPRRSGHALQPERPARSMHTKPPSIPMNQKDYLHRQASILQQRHLLTSSNDFSRCLPHQGWQIRLPHFQSLQEQVSSTFVNLIFRIRTLV